MSNWTPDPLYTPEDEPEPVKVQSNRVLRNLILALFAIAIVILALLLPPASRSGSDLPPQSRSVAPLAVVATSFQPLDLDAASAGTVPETVLPLSGTQQSDGGGITSDGASRGKAAFAWPSFGSRYLALPEGPGSLVRICSKVTCLTRTSNDAGPALSMQRQGRVADVSFVDFERLCGCWPPSLGLITVTITRLPGLPATDVR